MNGRLSRRASSRATRVLSRRAGAASGAEEPAQDVLQDPAVTEVLALARRVEANTGAERAVVGPNGHLTRLRVVDAFDREGLAPREAERLGALAFGELQREDPQHQQVRAVDPLVGLRDDGAHAEQVRPLGRPVARRARPVLLAGEDDQWHVLREVALRGVEDRRLLARGKVHRPGALAARNEKIP